MLETAGKPILSNLKARWQGWRRERRIARLTARLVRLSGRKHSPEQQRAWDALKAEITARSPQQVNRGLAAQLRAAQRTTRPQDAGGSTAGMPTGSGI